jgi:hypothetical protein
LLTKQTKSKNTLEFYTRPLGVASVQSGQGGDNTILTHNDEDEDADLEAQLLMMGGGAHKNQTLENPAATKRLIEIENRQKIFEDEIIKRIKEIQRYSKSIHLQVKKQA